MNENNVNLKKSIIQNISKAYPSSIHDKKLFICEYKDLTNKIDKSLKILGDKGYRIRRISNNHTHKKKWTRV